MVDQDIDTIVDGMTRILPILGKIFVRGIRTKTSYPQHVVHVMGALSHHGKLTMSGIGTHLSMPKPQVTTLIDRLVSEKLVERLNDENDRRIIYIQLTERGVGKFAEIKLLMTESLRSLLGDLDEATLSKLKDSSSYVAQILSELVGNQIDGCSKCDNPNKVY